MKNYLIIFFIIVAIFLSRNNVFAQEEEATVFEPSLGLNTIKRTDQTRDLITKLMYRADKGFVYPENHKVSFYYLDEGNEKFLATIKTTNDGSAILKLAANYVIPADEEGFMNFLARYEGNDTIAATEEQIAVKDLKMEMITEIIDSVKTVTVNAVSLASATDTIKEIEIGLFVERMFSDLPVADGMFDAGTVTMEFLKRIPGDKKGNIKVIARITENEIYGTVEVEKVLDWGIPSHLHIREVPQTRQLWTPIAPLWMIITLIIMLVGVWGHYIFSVIQLVRISKDGKNKS